MKKIINYVLGCGLVLLLMTACTEDEVKYDTSIVKDFEIQINNVPWLLNTGIQTRVIFIYKENGDYFANYSSHWQFALENGKYNFVSSDIPEAMISTTTNLNDLIIKQSPTGNQKVNMSDNVPYASPFTDTLRMNILTRTGTLRLKAKDVVGDPSYSTIKTTVFVKRSGYKVSDGTYVKEDVSVVRSLKTTSGGVNYLDDFIVFQTGEEANNVRIKIEFLNADSVVVNTKEIEGSFPILPNGVTGIDFNLNDPDTAIIKDYVLTINGEIVVK